MLQFYLDARGTLGIDDSSLVSPLVTVGCFSSSVGESFSLEDQVVPEMFNVLTDEGLNVSENSYQIALDISPPSKICSVMVQGRVGRIQFRMTGLEPDLIFHSRETEPSSILDNVYPSLTMVNMGTRLLCKGVTLHLEPTPGDPRLRFRPVFEVAKACLPSPLGVLLKASDNTKDFTIVAHGESIRVHKAVLAVSSEFFCKCIQYSDKITLDVPDAASIWSAAVGFMYDRAIDAVHFEDLIGLVRIGCEYLIGDLVAASVERVVFLIRGNLIKPAEDLVVAMSIGRRFLIQPILDECALYMQDNARALIMDHAFIQRYALLD